MQGWIIGRWTLAIFDVWVPPLSPLTTYDSFFSTLTTSWLFSKNWKPWRFSPPMIFTKHPHVWDSHTMLHHSAPWRLLLPNVVTYTAAMAALDKSSQWQRALAIFDAEKLGCNERSCSAAMYRATKGKWVDQHQHNIDKFNRKSWDWTDWTDWTSKICFCLNIVWSTDQFHLKNETVSLWNLGVNVAVKWWKAV